MRLKVELITAGDVRPRDIVTSSLLSNDRIIVQATSRRDDGFVILTDKHGVKRAFTRDRLLVLLNPRRRRQAKKTAKPGAQGQHHYLECPANTGKDSCICARLRRE